MTFFKFCTNIKEALFRKRLQYDALPVRAGSLHYNKHWYFVFLWLKYGNESWIENISSSGQEQTRISKLKKTTITYEVQRVEKEKLKSCKCKDKVCWRHFTLEKSSFHFRSTSKQSLPPGSAIGIRFFFFNKKKSANYSSKNMWNNKNNNKASFSVCIPCCHIRLMPIPACSLVFLVHIRSVLL